MTSAMGMSEQFIFLGTQGDEPFLNPKNEQRCGLSEGQLLMGMHGTDSGTHPRSGHNLKPLAVQN
jgi:hypothetical protein